MGTDSVCPRGEMGDLSQETLNHSADRKGYPGFTDVSNIYTRCVLTITLSMSFWIFAIPFLHCHGLHPSAIGKHWRDIINSFIGYIRGSQNIYAGEPGKSRYSEEMSGLKN